MGDRRRLSVASFAILKSREGLGARTTGAKSRYEHSQFAWERMPAGANESIARIAGEGQRRPLRTLRPFLVCAAAAGKTSRTTLFSSRQWAGSSALKFLGT
jgi:hypothetical protein